MSFVYSCTTALCLKLSTWLKTYSMQLLIFSFIGNKKTFKVAFSESSLSVLSKIYVELNVEKVKSAKNLHLENVGLLVNVLCSLSCMT